MDAMLPYIEAKGTYRQVGRQIGEAERELVRPELAYYGEQFAALAGFGFAERSRACSPLPQTVPRQFVPRIVDQLRGLAEGAGVPFDALFAANCNEEFTCLLRPGRRAPRPAATALRSRFTAGGRTVAGHNEDWYPGDIAFLTVRTVTLTDGTELPQRRARRQPAHHRSDVIRPLRLRQHGVLLGFAVGVPNNLLLTSLFECRSLEDVRDRIDATPRARGSNHLHADAAGRIWDIETTATRLAWIDGGGCFAHTNHYVTPELSPQDATTSVGTLQPARARRRVAGRRLSRPAKTRWSWDRRCSAITPTRRSRSARTGTTTTPIRPERHHGEHGLGAGRGHRSRGRRPALRARVRNVRSLGLARVRRDGLRREGSGHVVGEPVAQRSALDVRRVGREDGELEQWRGVHVHRHEIARPKCWPAGGRRRGRRPSSRLPARVPRRRVPRVPCRRRAGSRYEKARRELATVHADGVERPGVIVDRGLVTRLPAQHEELKGGGAAHQIARVGVRGEAGAALDQLGGDGQASREIHEPLLRELAHRPAAHLEDEVFES